MKIISSNTKKVLIVLLLIMLSVVMIFADGEDEKKSGADFVWILIAAFLVFWMQAGFAAA